MENTMNILIVDDIPMNRKLLRVILESKGFKTFEAGNGLEALDILEHEKIDLIISDILMPVMDGYRLCYEVRKSKNFSNVPLIIYTATYTSPSDEKLSFEFGADKYLKKPIPIEVLIQEIHQVMEHRKQHPQKEIKLLNDLDLMKEYSERLVSKLKEKNIDLQQILDELKQSEERYHTLAEAAHDVIFIVDSEGIYQYINLCGTQRFGMSPQEIIGKNIADVFTHEIAKENLVVFQRVSDSGQPFYEERELQYGTRKIWMGTRITPIPSNNGDN
jgi:PAS domain S-box-containing protein